VTTPDELAIFRSAARRYGRKHGFAGTAAIDGPPVLGPVRLMRDGRPIVAYRWLGSGRGQDYIQVEMDDETGAIVVHGARGDDALPASRLQHEPAGQEASRAAPADSPD
jgi:hypothetical protein